MTDALEEKLPQITDLETLDELLNTQ